MLRLGLRAVGLVVLSLSIAVAGSTSVDSSNSEPLGPSSRRGPLVISEIMYHPAPRNDGRRLEFVELYNSQPWDEDISGHRISGDIDFTFPLGTIFPALSFLVIAKSPDDLRAVYAIANVLGPFSGDLSNSSGTLLLQNETGAVLLEIEYASKSPWPASSDGTGHSLVLARPSYGENDPKAWAQSDSVGGSPGVREQASSEPLRALMINEFLVRGTAQQPAFIEVYNHSNDTLGLSGCILRSDHDQTGYKIPAGTEIGPRGFLSFSEAQSGLKLSPKNGAIFLWNADGTRVLDAVNYEGQALGISIGRVPDGASAFYPLQRATPAAANSPILLSDIVINEIMYDPISGDQDDQYVELYNHSSRAVDLSGWQFVHGITFTFPTNAMLPAGGYGVLAKNAAHLIPMYPSLNSANTFGDFQGSLSHKGERLALARPEVVAEDNKPATTVPVIVDEVTFYVGGRWGQWAHGGGSSLELIDSHADRRLASNWADSDETQKSAWRKIEFTGKLDNGAGSADSLQVIMLGGGECLLDNVEVIGSSFTNQVLNGDFELGMTNWVAQGTHVRSTIESGTGIDGRQCLHIRASEEGDTGANRIRAKLSGKTFTSGQTATIRAQARWLHGHPEILLRFKGNYLEATGDILTTHGFGTPGLPNSRALANAGPAIYEVTHAPAVPPANQQVIVTARVNDPEGLISLLLYYRIDPVLSYVTIPMVDDGSGGDDIAGDGIYSASIPGQGTGTLVAFYIEATDNAASPARTAFPNNAPTRECLVRFGDPEPVSNFGTYRLWLTQATVDTWAKRENLSHEPLEGTFVYGDSRVIYNCDGRFSGSPYHQQYNSPTGNPCQYSLGMPDDDLVLGTTSFNKIHAPGNSPLDDPTIQTEQTAYWLARKLGLPYNYKRYIQLYVNGKRRGQLMEDTLVPGPNMVAQFFPNDHDGDLHKLYGWFEFANTTAQALAFDNLAWATLQNFTTTGGAKKVARYRWNWRPRAVHGSANDFTNLFALVDVANNKNPNTYVQNLLAKADIEQWMRTFAVEHAVGNWDSYGNSNGQNMYAYKPEQGPWVMLIWDYNIVLGNGSDGPTGDDVFKVADPVISTIYNTPVFRRAYWRAMKELMNGPMLTNNVNALLDARYAAFKANGAAVSSPISVKSWIARRRTYLLSKLKAVAADFNIADNDGADFSTDQNPITLRGTAPIEVRTIKVNGVEFPVTWMTVTNWNIRIPLTTVTNTLVLEGLDERGEALSNATATVNVALTRPDRLSAFPIFINEWMVANRTALPDPVTGSFAPWFELYNSSTVTVDLTGYTLTDDPDNGTRFVVPANVTLAPNSFLLVWAGGAASSPPANSSDLYANFLLRPEGGAILLYTSNGILVDSVAYSGQSDDVSEGRFPDGEQAPFYLMSRPTPRSPNVMSQDRITAPQFIGAEITADGLMLRWTAQPGRTYHVQFKSDLAESVWHNLAGDVIAAGSWAAKTDSSLGAKAQRFYRIEVVE